LVKAADFKKKVRWVEGGEYRIFDADTAIDSSNDNADDMEKERPQKLRGFSA